MPEGHTGEGCVNWQDLIGRVWCGDALDWLRAWPDGSADLVLTDPPFNAGINYGGGFNDRRPWPEWAAWLDIRIRDMERVSSGLVLVFASVTGLLEFTRHVRRPNWVGVWYKPMSLSHRVGGSPWLPHWEPIMAFGKAWGEGGRVPAYSLPDVIRCNPAERNEHPCPKPIPLLARILRDIPAQVVFDPFAGSGSTGVAAVREGRMFAGCDLNPDYCAMAEKRIGHEREKMRLDFGEAAVAATKGSAEHV